MTPAFAYLQSRLQAHHGQRLDEQGWQRLERVISYRLFLKNARETSLAPWLQAISDGESDVAVLEHRLREALRHSVTQTARWAPPPWQPAITWTIHLWQLPAWRHHWQHHPLPPGFLLADTAAVAPLEQAWASGTPLLEAWLTHWRHLWPATSKTERQHMEQLIHTLQTHADQFATLPDHTTACTARQQLQQRLSRLFRQWTAQPAALFIYLVRMALDFERLRGGLVQRALYHTTEGETI